MPSLPVQIYIVDDESSVCTAYARLVLSARMQPRTFGSAEEFMRADLSDENACVISDVRMPGTSGLELPTLLARSRRHLPVIFITGHDTPETREMAQRVGAAAYFRKPVDDRPSSTRSRGRSARGQTMRIHELLQPMNHKLNRLHLSPITMRQRNYLALGLTALATGVLIFFPACKKEETVKALPPPDVLVIDAGTRDVPVYREWIGTLDGSENAEIRARVTGHLLERDYQEGALVKKGDVLFQIDPRPFEATLAEAKSELGQAQAVQLAAQAEAERSQELFDKKVISEKEHTNKIQLNLSNVAKVEALKANVEQAQLNLNFCKVTSPVEGVVGIARAQVGDLVGTANSTVLTSVSTLDPIKIVFPVGEAEYLAAANRIQELLAVQLDKRSESIELILADGKTFPNKARLLSVDRQVNASTGTILVTAILKNPGSVLRPGLFARARVIASTLRDAVVVPQRAVMEIQSSYQLAIVGADGKAEIRPVQVGPRLGTDWVITSGLKAGEKVIVEGIQKVKAGVQVTAKPWIPPAERSSAPAVETKPAEHPET